MTDYKVFSNVEVSLFMNYTSREPARTVDLETWLKSAEYRTDVLALRAEPDENVQAYLKSRMPAITPSGVFSRRGNAYLVKPSGLICIDIDGKHNPCVDIKRLRWQLFNYPFFYYVGMSVGNNGLFCLIPDHGPDKHIAYFHRLQEFFMSLGVKIDRACSDIGRLRGASYNPGLPVNTEAVPFPLTDDTVIPKRGEVSYNETLNKFGQTRIRVRYLLNTIETHGIDITDDYKDWYAIGRALFVHFGRELGEQWFHRISRFSPKYNPDQCTGQFKACCTSNHGNIGALFAIAKKYNLLVPKYNLY